MKDCLSAFTLLWCAQQALLLFYTQLASPFEKAQALLVAAATLSSAWPPALCAALCAALAALRKRDVANFSSDHQPHTLRRRRYLRDPGRGELAEYLARE